MQLPITDTEGGPYKYEEFETRLFGKKITLQIEFTIEGDEAGRFQNHKGGMEHTHLANAYFKVNDIAVDTSYEEDDDEWCDDDLVKGTFGLDDKFEPITIEDHLKSEALDYLVNQCEHLIEETEMEL